MSADRFFYVIVALALVAIIALTAREALVTLAVVADRRNPATRTYLSWAKAAQCQIAIESFEVGSATRTYIGMAKAVECQDH
jgi:hypothetical protein